MSLDECCKHPGIFDGREIQSLGKLAIPSEYSLPLVLEGWDLVKLKRKLDLMILIRVAEEEIGIRVEAGQIKCPCHLAIGQEAVAVGVSDPLRVSDRIFGGHRSHAHYLAVDGSLDGLTAEVFGKASGCSRGMGGSMHLLALERGFMGSVPIVGATIPIAAGAALAAKLDRSNDIAVAYFGDGAVEEGSFHESLNLAAAHKLPVLFVCENNLYSSHLDISLRQPCDSVGRFGGAHKMPTLVIDGNDVTATIRATTTLVEVMRKEGGPAFLEAVTFRHRGHVGPDENVDVGVRRSSEDLQAWKKRDPIFRLSSALKMSGALTEPELERTFSDFRDKVRLSFEKAERSPYPESAALLEKVFV